MMSYSFDTFTLMSWLCYLQISKFNSVLAMKHALVLAQL